MARVAVTGIGLITPLGHDWQEFGKQVAAGNSAIVRQRYSLEGFPDIELPVAPVTGFDAATDIPNCKVKTWDRLGHFALFAARNAVKDSGVEGPEVDALILGSSTTSVETLDENYWRFLRGNGRISPLMISRSMPNAPVCAVSMDLGIRGISYAIASACSSSNQAIIAAAELIRSGSAKLAMTGGVEASLSYSNLSAWRAMHVLTDDTCRPFCSTRSGLVMGEGATIFVLEAMDHAIARGAHVYAEIIGWGQSSDARSLTTPDEGGITLALRNAIDHSGISPQSVDYINAHGTGTELNDLTEAAALSGALGGFAGSIPVSSTKALHGHLLGASGGIELAATIAGMEGGFIPPNANLINQDTNILLRVPQVAETSNIVTAFSSSFAFGGHNSVLVVRIGKR